jgi:uncharacterized membrane protein (UPF0127 family)
MRSATIYVSCLSQPLCHHAWLAEHAHQRLRGLLFRPALRSGEGLLLLSVSSIHTIGMQHALDILFLSSDFVITAMKMRLPPPRIALSPPDTRHALELPPGTAELHGCMPGDRLLIARKTHDAESGLEGK